MALLSAATGEKPSSLVPDVAYVSRERLPRESGRLPEKPTIAPDIAVEIISPDERRRALNEKIALYLANGAQLVIAVDPQDRSVTFHEPNRPPGVFRRDEVASLSAFSDLTIDLAKLFADL